MDEAPFDAATAEGPQHGAAYWVQADDGIRLRVGVWNAEASRCGTVLIFPGRTEYIEKHGRTALELAERGFSSCVIDWRGQGLSDRLAADPMISHVERFADYHKDVEAMLDAADTLGLAKPWYLLGHSMGACIGLRAVIDGLPVAACAFTAPMWDIHVSPVQRIAVWPVSWMAQAVGKGRAYAPGSKGQRDQCYVLSVGFDENRLTNDPDMFQYMVNQATQLSDRQTGAPSMGWLFQTLKETRSLSQMPSPDVPCAAFCGSREIVVGICAIQDRIERWPGGTLEFIDGAKHDLLSEVPAVRQRVIAQTCELFMSVGRK